MYNEELQDYEINDLEIEDIMAELAIIDNITTKNIKNHYDS